MTIFYKLRHATNDNLEFYIGSTDNSLHIRTYGHKSRCNNPNNNRYNFKVYQYIRANGGFNNWRCEVLLEVEGLTKLHKLRRERELTELHGATLNTNKAGAILEVGGMKEYKQQHDRQHRQQHGDELRHYDRQRGDKNNVCDRCGSIYRGRNTKRHQQSQKCQQLAKVQQIVIHIQ